MCLTVREVPATYTDSLIMKCYKTLHRKYSYPYNKIRYKTPYMLTTVPENGWLCTGVRTNKYYLGEHIFGGHIHSHLSKSRYVFISYAFFIKAFGHGDLISKALYIPDIDYTKDKENNLKIIEHLLSLKRPTENMIIKHFPHLAKYARKTHKNSKTIERNARR
jgi:hypothetical protein